MKLQRLKDLRHDAQLTQRDMANLLKTTQPQYSKYESGERSLPLEHLVTLANYFHTSTDYLLGRTNDPKPPKK